MNKKNDLTAEQKILDVAERLFLERGFVQTSTADIAKEAGCNYTLINYYFRTKEKLFQKIFENKIGLLFGAFLAPDNPEDSFEDNLKRKIEAHFDLLAQNPKLPMLILSDMIGNKERIALAKDAMGAVPYELFEKIEQSLRVEIEKGAVRPIKAQDLMMNIMSLNVFAFISMPLFSQIMNISEEQKQGILEHRKQEIIEAILRSLRP